MTTAASSTLAAPSSAPNPTLYCSNLPDKLQKEDLKRALYMLFALYGPVLDIVALKTKKMRGQAHVLFRDTASSTLALRALQGHDFFGKQMNISYAKSKSDTLAKLDGTYKQPAPAAPAPAPADKPSDLQQSIFAGPPGTNTAVASSTAGPPPGLKPAANGADSAPSPAGQGVKRAREDDSDDEKDEAPMDMDEDAAMDESDAED